MTIVAFTLHILLFYLCRPFSKDPEWTSIRLTWPIIRIGFWLCRFRFTSKGASNIPTDQPFILVSNHQSHLDIVAYLRAIPIKFAFVAKRELLSVPILGRDIRGQGHIAIDRNDPRESIKALKNLETSLKNGKSLLLFAEGTRSIDGTMGPFKKGAFMMAIHANVPIIPCAIEGTYKLLNKKSLLMSPGSIQVQIGTPIYPKHVSSKTQIKEHALELMAQTKACIEQMRDTLIQTNV